jgi:hypothetical protein
LFFTASFLDVVFDQAQCRAPQNAEVRVSVAAADTRLVFAEGDIELPMQTVFDSPMSTHRYGEAKRRHHLAQNGVPNFRRLLAAAKRIADDHADCRQLGPAAAVGQITGHGANWLDGRKDGIEAVVRWKAGTQTEKLYR